MSCKLHAVPEIHLNIRQNSCCIEKQSRNEKSFIESIFLSLERFKDSRTVVDFFPAWTTVSDFYFFKWEKKITGRSKTTSRELSLSYIKSKNCNPISAHQSELIYWRHTSISWGKKLAKINTGFSPLPTAHCSFGPFFAGYTTCLSSARSWRAVPWENSQAMNW